jgi:outer membrane protein assembly factor BamB
MDDIRSLAYRIEIVKKISEVPQLKWSSIVIVTCLLCSCITARGTDDWPMFQHDPQHSGFSPSSVPLSLKERWVHEEYGKDQMDFVISGKRLFVARWSTLSALDIDDGSVLWSFGGESRPDLGLRSFPAVADNRVYMSAFQEILCLDAGTGRILWNHEVRFLDFTSSPISIGEHVIIGGGTTQTPFHYSQENVRALEYALKCAKRLLCLNARTGEVLWEFYAADIADATPAYFNGRIYINDGFRNIYCLDEHTGDLVWERKIEQMTCSSLSLNGKRIFVGTSEGMVCLKLETGDILWKFNCDWTSETPAVAYGKVFSGSFDGIFYCLNAEDGELVWEIETGSGISEPKGRISCPAIVADGKVAFGTGNGVLYIVDAKSGKIHESVDLGESSISALALSDGKLFIGQDNGKITCFEGSAPREFNSSILIGIVNAFFFVTLLLVLWIRTRRR